MKLFWQFRRYFLKHKVGLVIVVILVILSTLSEGAGIGLFYPLIEYIQKGNEFLSDSKMKIFSKTISWFGMSPSPLNFILLIFVVLLIRYITVNANVFVSTLIKTRVQKDIRDHAFDRLLNSSLYYFNDTSSGKMVNMLMEEVNKIGYIIYYTIQFIVNMAFFLLYMVGVFLISWEMTIIVFAMALVRYKAITAFIKKARQLNAKCDVMTGYMNTYVIGIYQGIDVIKSYATENKEVNRFEDTTERYMTINNRLVLNSSLMGIADGMLAGGLLCFIIYMAITVFKLPGSVIMVFLFIVYRVIPSVNALNEARLRVSEFSGGIIDLKRIFDDRLMDFRKWGNIEKRDFVRNLVLDNVSFSYSGDEHLAIDSVNLVIRKNEKIAIVGESGSGKTTLVRMLLRLYDPIRGSILIDGIPISDIHPDSWKRLISVVSQDTFIFDDTVENNVRYGVDRCTGDEFRKALRLSRSDDFIAELPMKEKSLLGERGVRLSGGQRQRIAIARAFLRDSPILILDEATSALDSITEHLIQSALDDLSKDRTMIIIAHRLSTIRNADRIIVLDKGRIAETGTHEQLLGNDSLYKQYHNLQLT